MHDDFEAEGEIESVRDSLTVCGIDLTDSVCRVVDKRWVGNAAMDFKIEVASACLVVGTLLLRRCHPAQLRAQRFWFHPADSDRLMGRLFRLYDDILGCEVKDRVALARDASQDRQLQAFLRGATSKRATKRRPAQMGPRKIRAAEGRARHG